MASSLGLMVLLRFMVSHSIIARYKEVLGIVRKITS